MQVPLDVLIAIWRDTADLHQFLPPATDTEIAEAESQLGIQFPGAFRELYRFSNGLSLVSESTQFFSLFGQEPSGPLVSASRELRALEWPIPAKALPFGACQGGEPYALWIGVHDRRRFPEPIVEIGMISGTGCMGLAAPSLGSFLLGETVVGLALEERPEALLDHLRPFGLTREILPDPAAIHAFLHEIAKEPGDSMTKRAMDGLHALHRWANPWAESRRSSPYTARLGAPALGRLLA
jgi:hypothetical protein